jgi:RNA polymerase-binding transcription factor DksA
MATIRNLVKFATKFLKMAKGKDKKKTVAKAKSKPAAKKVSKPAKKAAPKKVAKKAAKPAKKVKVKPAPKAKAVAKKKGVVKPKAKVAKPVAAKAIVKKAAAPVKSSKSKATNHIEKKAPPVKPIVRQQAVKAVAAPKSVPVANKNGKTTLKHTMSKKGKEKDLNLRYSDEELKEFKDLIDKKLASAREELKNLKEALDNHTESQAGNKAWNMEEGTDTSEMEYLMNQISRQHQYIRNLELALIRVENKTYGICRISGKLIPKERLRIVPHATLSLEAKMTRKNDDVSPGAAITAPPTDFSEGFED